MNHNWRCFTSQVWFRNLTRRADVADLAVSALAVFAVANTQEGGGAGVFPPMAARQFAVIL